MFVFPCGRKNIDTILWKLSNLGTHDEKGTTSQLIALLLLSITSGNISASVAFGWLRLGGIIKSTKSVSPNLNDDNELPELFIRQEVVERVHGFLYLGSLVGDSYNLGIFEDVRI